LEGDSIDVRVFLESSFAMAMTKKIKESNVRFQAEMKVFLVFNGSV
jgi:hypothetical protein